jgi:serine protease Do
MIDSKSIKNRLKLLEVNLMRTKQIPLITVVIVTLLLSACSALPLAQLGLPSAGQSTANQAQSAASAAQVQLPASSALASQESLAAQQGTLEDIYTNVNPSVVNVQVVMPASAASLQLPQDFNNPFGQSPSNPQSGNPVQQALGSGFILDKNGYIVTNNHVVDGATQVTVTFSDGSSYPATVVGKDVNSDLAVIKVNDAPADLLKPVTLANSDQLKVGQMAIAIGNPYGLEGTMTVGIVSALGRSLPVDMQAASGGSYTIPDVIQTDAPINPGNSGGVLLDDQGQVIGVTSAIESQSGANAGIGFAIPVNIVQKIVPELMKNGAYQHPYLGISGVTLSSAMAKEMGLSADQRGILVETVTAGSPAEKAGLKASEKQVQIDGTDFNVGGDVITAVDGQPVKRFDDLVSYLFASTTVGKTIKLDILRDGKEKTLDLTLAARPASTEQASTQPNQTQPKNSSGKAWLGIQGMDMNKDIASAMNLDQNQNGVLVVDVQSGSPAEAAGLLGSTESVTINNQSVNVGGDIITAYNGQPINSLAELKAALSKAAPGDDVELAVLRDGQLGTVTVTLGSAPSN